jgi:hypothetical protein
MLINNWVKAGDVVSEENEEVTFELSQVLSHAIDGTRYSLKRKTERSIAEQNDIDEIFHDQGHGCSCMSLAGQNCCDQGKYSKSRR